MTKGNDLIRPTLIIFIVVSSPWFPFDVINHRSLKLKLLIGASLNHGELDAFRRTPISFSVKPNSLPVSMVSSHPCDVQKKTTFCSVIKFLWQLLRTSSRMSFDEKYSLYQQLLLITGYFADHNVIIKILRLLFTGSWDMTFCSFWYWRTSYLMITSSHWL